MEEVETFLQTKTHDGLQHKDANYIIAILDSRKAFVAHERFQYVLLKKFGEIDLPVSKGNDNIALRDVVCFLGTYVVYFYFAG